MSRKFPPPAKKPRRKFCYVGAPAIFALEQACQQINDAFGDYGCYLVGSALERPDFRDVDVRFIMEDGAFDALFPGIPWKRCRAAVWEHDPRWLLINVAICERLRAQTGLPIDFQIQPQSHSNEFHSGSRQPVGFRLAKES